MEWILIEGKRIWKWITVYIITIGFGYFLFSAIWGGVNGLMVGARLAEDPTFRQELGKILTPDELTRFDIRNFQRLPEDKRVAIQALLERRFGEINWLPIHILVNAFTFAILGLILGFFRLSRYSALVPIGLLFMTWRALSADQFVFYTKWLTIFLGLSTQFLTVYLFSFIALRLRSKILNKRDPKTGQISR